MASFSCRLAPFPSERHGDAEGEPSVHIRLSDAIIRDGQDGVLAREGVVRRRRVSHGPVGSDRVRLAPEQRRREGRRRPGIELSLVSDLLQLESKLFLLTSSKSASLINNLTYTVFHSIHLASEEMNRY